MAVRPHHGGVEQGHAAANAATSASALGWLVAAGLDMLVGDAPRNWLAAPPAANAPAPAPVTLALAATTAATAPAGATAAAAAAADLAGLDAAVAGFAHPLRRADLAPQLLTGEVAAGLIVLGDWPDAADSPEARLAARMLAAIGLDDANSARAHLLPWPSPGGRPASDDAIAAFAPFLARALALARPRCILALGDKAVALAGQDRGLASLRGQWLAIADVPTLATFHPRRLLAQPELKRLAWADLQSFAARLKAH